MSTETQRTLYIAEYAGRRVAVAADSAQRAHQTGLTMLQMQVGAVRGHIRLREPNARERAAFEAFAKSYGPGSDVVPAALPLPL